VPHIIILGDGDTWEEISETDSQVVLVEVSDQELEDLSYGRIRPQDIDELDGRAGIVSVFGHENGEPEEMMQVVNPAVMSDPDRVFDILTYSIHLSGVREGQRLKAMKTLRKTNGFNLTLVKDIIDHDLPFLLYADLKEEEVADLRTELEEGGFYLYVRGGHEYRTTLEMNMGGPRTS